MAIAQLSKPRNRIDVLSRKPRSLLSDSISRLRKNQVAIISILFSGTLVVAALAAPWITTGDYAKQDLTLNNAVPNWMTFLLPEGAEKYAKLTDEARPFGYDDLGRDLWTRVIYGARVSLSVAFVAASVSLLIGAMYGLISGYVGLTVDAIMMRFVDFLYGFPFLIMVILLQTYFKALARRGEGEGLGQILVDLNTSTGGMFFLFIAIGLINWLGMARITRGQVLSLREKEFVEAARSVGSSHTRIIFKHLLPNLIGPLIVFESLAIPGYIALEAFLSFIGLGVDPPTPSWGIMIAETAQSLRSYPNQLLIPAAVLTLTTLAFNFMGDGLRDAFDPRQKV